MKRTHLTILLGILLITDSCGQKKEKFTNGQVNGDVYSNDFFKISMPIPLGWYYFDNDGLPKLVEENIERLNIQDKEQAKQVEDQKENVKMIFALFKYKPDTIIEVNPNITLTATRISQYQELKNIDYAIKAGQKEMTSMNPNFSFDKDIYTLTIGNKQFKGYHAVYSADGLTANYEMMIANFDNYNLNITYSYKDTADKDRLFEIIKGVKIE